MTIVGRERFGDAGTDTQFRYADWERAVAALGDNGDDDGPTIVRGLD